MGKPQQTNTPKAKSTLQVKSKQPKKEETPKLNHPLPIELQQLLLSIFKNTFPEILSSKDLQLALQEVKGALYERDFKRAFSKDEYLEAYAVRWSPSRALCYGSVLVELRECIVGILRLGDDEKEVEDSVPVAPLRVVSFGGGAAEVVAFGGFLRYLLDASKSRGKLSNAKTAAVEGSLKLDLCLVDSAQWGKVVEKLGNSLVTPPPLSKYTSSSAREANRSLISSGIQSTVHVKDALELSQQQLANMCGEGPSLITLLFTLNELYTTSIGKTTTFLLSLASVFKAGSLLLVVDSPGSYSETMIGEQAKKYPMKWLIDHTLLEAQKNESRETAPKWTKLVSEDFQWFRLPDNLRYPIPLENMRYQLHLYRRI